MAFSADYPHVFQWVSHHGKMTISQIDENTIEVAISDAGGIPDDGRFLGATIDEALSKADQTLPGWLTESKKLLDSLISGELETSEFEYICVPGWPPVKNPFYRAA